ncbi:MAG: hypothetical protein RBT69_01200 [Spirochaetia bacterium]|jgi:hypothetical protein|nr:hypothetical protein [Spirochaetia bacterium]
MPEIRDIDKLKDRLNSLGDEPAIMAELGEEIADVKPESGELPDDISALLGSFEDDGITGDNSFQGLDEESLENLADLTEFSDGPDAGMEDTVPPDDFSAAGLTGEEDESVDDLGKLLDELPEDFETEDETGEAPKDIDDLFGDSSLDFDDNPDQLLDQFSQQEEEAADDTVFGALDDFETDSDAEADIATDAEESFDLGDLSDIDDSELESDVSEAEPLDNFELPSLDLTGGEDQPADADSDEKIDGFAEDAISDEDFDIGDIETISVDDEFDDTDVKLPDIKSGEDEPEDLFEDLDEIEELGDLETLDDEELNKDEFSLEDLGEEFGNIDELDEIEQEKEVEEPPEAAAETPDLPPHQDEEAAGQFYISADKLKQVTDTLAQLPWNLKFFIEDLIGNKELAGRNLDVLVDKLASGASPREIADLVFKISGKRIKIPAQYDRKTWEELEKEKATLSYIIKNKVVPFVARSLVFLFVAYFLYFIGFNFVWKPARSYWLYQKGYEALQADKYDVSENYFIKASKLRANRKQFYRYADLYIEKRKYNLAEKKYIQMIGPDLSSVKEGNKGAPIYGFFREDKKAFLDYAALKTFYQGEYENAERIIDDYLNLHRKKWDYEMLISKIDNYLNWAVKDEEKYANAEYTINDSLFKFGKKPELYFRKIASDLRSGKLSDKREKAAEASAAAEEGKIPLEKRQYYGKLGEYRGYIENIKEKHLDPYIAVDFYRYLIDTGNVDGIERELIKLSNMDKKLSEPHYQLSRLWRIIEKSELERKSLKNVEELTGDDSLSRIREEYPHSYMYARKTRKNFEIASLNRLGFFEKRDGKILIAQKYYQRAINEYENNLDLLGKLPEYGKLYEDLGDIYYYNAGKYTEAYREFMKAEGTGYRDSNLSYKIGFIYYKNQNYTDASERFYNISLDKRDNESVLLAFANSSYYNNVFSPAMAFYEQVVEKLEYWRDHQGFIELDTRRDQQLVLEKLMEVYNNLGVTLYRLSEKNRNSSYYSSSLVYLTKSAELYDLLSRDPETLNRSFTKPLAQVNMRHAIINAGRKTNQAASVIPYSKDNMEIENPVIYNAIDQDIYGRIEMLTEQG